MKACSVFWLCYQNPEGVCVVLQRASSLVNARMKAAIAGLDAGEFKEGHALDAKMARRIPKEMIGRALSAAQAKRLLTLLDRKRA